MDAREGRQLTAPVKPLPASDPEETLACAARMESLELFRGKFP